MNLRCLPILVLLMLSFFWTEAREISVKEVTVALHQKPVTGYRLVLDRSQSFVSQQVRKHISNQSSAQAFEYDRSIIFENILYSPVSPNHKISLYFMLRGLEGSLTELTVVAMYDYQRSISSRDFPRLSMNLLADLSSLVRKTSGDLIKFGEILFDDQTVREMKADRGRSQSDPSDPVEHFEEEEVENNQVLVRGDPFQQKNKSNPDSLSPAELAARIKALEKREAEVAGKEKQLLADQQRFQISQEKLRKQLTASKVLQDSIRRLNRELSQLDRIALTADDVSFTSGDNQQVARLQVELQQKELRQQALIRSNDSLRAQISDFRSQVTDLRNQKEDIEHALGVALDDLERMEARIAENTSPSLAPDSRGDSLQALLQSESLLLSQARKKQDELEGKNYDLQQKLTVSQQKQASLQRQIRELQAQPKDSETRIVYRENRSKIDSLSHLLSQERRDSKKLEQDLLQEKKTLQGQVSRSQKNEQELRKQIRELQAQPKDSETRIVYRENRAKIDSLSQLLSNERLNRQKLQAQLAASSKTDPALTDSLRLMRQRIRSLQVRQGQQAILEADLQLAQEKIQSLQKEQADKRQEHIKLEQDLKIEQERTRQLSRQIGVASNDLSNTQKQLEKARQGISQKDAQVDKLQNEIKQLQNQNSAAVSEKAQLQDSLFRVTQSRNRLEAFLSKKNSQFVDLNQKNDSLLLALNNSQAGEQRLQTRLSLVEEELDSLQNFLEHPDEQTRFIREQWEKLEDWEIELAAEKVQMDDREKLLSQKERSLALRKQELEEQEKKYQQLQEWEDRLKIREQQLKQKENNPNRGPSPDIGGN